MCIVTIQILFPSRQCHQSNSAKLWISYKLAKDYWRLWYSAVAIRGLHTSGVNPKRLKEIIDITDWIGFDIKTNFERYETITRNKVSAKLAKESLDIILKSNVAYEIRTTVDSRYITFEELNNIAKLLSDIGIQKWVLQDCILRTKTDEQKLSLPNTEEIEQLEQYLEIEVRRQ